MQQPMVCTLSNAELRERRLAILDSIRHAALDVTALSFGYAYRFESTPEMLARLHRLMNLERGCCPFLTFRIVTESGDRSVRLEVTGPPEARTVIADIFGSESSTPL